MYNNNNNNGGYGNNGFGGGYNNSNNNGFGGNSNANNNGYGRNNGGGYNNNSNANNNGFGGGYSNGGGYNNGGAYNNSNNSGFGGGGYNNSNNNGFGGNNNSNYQQNYSIDMPSDNGFGGGDDVANCPEYQATAKNTHQITVAVTTLTKLVQQLGTPKDSLEIREKIRSCVEQTTHLISQESSKVKTLTNLSNRARDPKVKLSYQKLVKEYNNCLQQFKEIAQVATKKERSTPLPQSHPPQHQQQQSGYSQGGRNNNSNNNGNYYNSEQYYDDEKEAETQSLMEASRRQQLAQVESEREYQNSIIQEREEGIRQIEQSIVEINEIFMDLSTMVSEQGVMLNTIEHSLESTVMNTQEGVVQIKKASEHQKSARTKMCWLALILFIVAGVLAVILYFSLRK